MTEQVETQVAADTAAEAPAHGVILTDVAATKVKSLLEQEGRDVICGFVWVCSPAAARA